MADYASRALLTPPGEYSKPQQGWRGKRSTYKLPLLIFSLLSTLLACIAASLFILLKSHEDPVKKWKIRPSILLSILAGAYAVALGGLFTTAVAVTWWIRITHVTTLKQLHFIQSGASPKGFFLAFRAGDCARRVAIVALLVFGSKVATGPMLQRSTRPREHEATRDIEMKIDLASRIPDGWLGTWGSLYAQAIGVSQGTLFNDDIRTKNTSDYACPGNGTCHGTVPGAGLDFVFKYDDSERINILDPSSSNATVFNINLTMGTDFGEPMLYLDTQFISEVTEDCIVTLRKETYYIVPATIHYPITIRNGLVKPNFTQVIENNQVISNYTSPADIKPKNVSDPIGPLMGLRDALGPIYNAQALRGLDKPTAYRFVSGNDFWADMFLKMDVVPGSTYPENVIKKCSLMFYSPTQYILRQMLSYTFRAAQQVALERDDEEQYKQDFVAVHTYSELWYITDFRWLAASAATMLIGLMAASSLLWGWWRLDRYVTLSPLETAKALGAPVLASKGPEQEADSIVEEAGHETVALDGDELLWSGSLYTTGARAGGSLRAKSSKGTDKSAVLEDAEAHASSSPPRRRTSRRRGVRSLNAADPIRMTRSFEHDPGYTTRRPYEDEEEMDIGQYGRPWAGSEQAADHVPLIQMLSNIAAPDMAPRMDPRPPVHPVGSVSPVGDRGKRRRSSLPRGTSLPRIDERNTSTAEGPGG